MIVALPTGADLRLTNDVSAHAVVLANGGTAKTVAGTWSATSELLVTELAPRFPAVRFAEIRYRVKTWNELPSCVADADAALDHVAAEGARDTLLVGFSMGGAVSIGAASHPTVDTVLGLAPWIPDRLPVETMRGKRLDVVHGSWDRWFPGVPGVSPSLSRRGFERTLAAGATGSYRLIPHGLHGAALRRRDGSLFRLPRWRDWVEAVADAVAAHAAA